MDLTKFDYTPKPIQPFQIDSNKLDYTKPKNPIEKIISSDKSNTEKIELIRDLLVKDYKIIDGQFAYLLAVYTVGDKKIINGHKKMLKKQEKKLIKKNKLIL
jgi:hypothetical protein